MTLNLESILIRITVAAFCGGLIGFQRERKDRPAGFRTHILVSLGSALFMIVSISKFPVPTDPTRIAAQVVTGIGFLGAGSIIRQGNYIHGLTTAASLWSVAAIGLAAGGGFYSAAGAGTLLIFTTLSIFKIIETRITTQTTNEILEFFTSGNKQITTVKDILEVEGLDIVSVEAGKRGSKGFHVVLELSSPAEIDKIKVSGQILEIEGVTRLKWSKVPIIPTDLLNESQ